MSIHGHRVFTDWVAATLTAGGLNVGRSVAPPTHDPLKGYVVLHPIAGGVVSGSIDAPLDDASPNIQVTAVSNLESQALWLADRARTILNEAVPTLLSDGRRVLWLDFLMASPTVRRDDDIQPPKFVAIDRMEMGTTP